MEDPHDPRSPILDALRARSGVIIATIGMIAWIALLWAMFGDVL